MLCTPVSSEDECVIFFRSPLALYSPQLFSLPMPQHLYTFRKAEHLCLKKEIEALFSAGCISTSQFPLRATFRTLPYAGVGPQVKILLSVSKRHFKHAVDRNRAKRQLREAYRLQKQHLLEQLPQDVGVHLAFIWLSDRPMPSSLVHKRVGGILHRVAEKVNEREAKLLAEAESLAAQNGGAPVPENGGGLC